MGISDEGIVMNRTDIDTGYFDDNGTDAKPNPMELLALYSASFASPEPDDSSYANTNIDGIAQAVNVAASSRTNSPTQTTQIIPSNPTSTASSSIRPNKDEISKELEQAFNRMSPACVRSFMVRLKRLVNRQLAQDAAELILLLNKGDYSRIIEEIQNFPH